MNKSVLILGASTGIGAVLARFFVKAGYDVHGCARREPENWENVGTITKIVCDVSNSKDFKINHK